MSEKTFVMPWRATAVFRIAKLLGVTVVLVGYESGQADFSYLSQNSVHGKIVDALCGMAVAGCNPAELTEAARNLSAAVGVISVSPCAQPGELHISP